MFKDCVGASFCDFVDDDFHILQAIHWAYGDAVVEGYNDGALSVSVHDAVESDFFAYFAHVRASSECIAVVSYYN